MAIFTVEEHGEVIERCSLNGEDVTRLTTCANIDTVTFADIPPPIGHLLGKGWIDLLETMEQGYPYFIVGSDGQVRVKRHYGMIRLEWKQDAR